MDNPASFSMDNFPYKHLSISKDQILERFARLRDYEFVIMHIKYTIHNIPLTEDERKYCGEYILIKNNVDDYWIYNLISDYFMDKHRVHANRRNTLSPYNFWQQNQNYIRDHAMKKFGYINSFTLRESIYYLCPEATSFRSTVAMGFYKMFSAKSILDISSGWGDRLIAAIAANIDYCGVDPNSQLVKSYAEIIDTFASENKHRYCILQEPFETATLPDRNYDMILTSPPYYDAEIYADEVTQSIHNRTIEQWITDFLFVSIKKAWDLLCENGHMILIMNDLREGPRFVKRTVESINSGLIAGAQYLGVISHAEFKKDKPISPQPCWIWKKVEA